jgi:hypothetical protein
VERQLDEGVRRECVRRLEQTRSAVHDLRGLQQEPHDHRMDVLTHHERRGRREQEDVVVGHVSDEVDDALAERDGRQEPISRRVGERAPHAPEADGRTEQEAPHQGNGRRHDEEGGVDPAGLQRRRRALAREGQERRVLGGDSAVAEQAHRERPNAAAFLADLDAQATEIRKAAQHSAPSMEQPHRLVVEAPQRAQSLARYGLGGSALDEARHGLAGREALERLDRPGTRQDLDGEAVRGGQPRVLLREHVVGAALSACDERDPSRRQRLDQMVEDREDDHHDDQGRHEHPGQLFPVHRAQSKRRSARRQRILSLLWASADGWIAHHPWVPFGRPVSSRRSAPWSR